MTSSQQIARRIAEARIARLADAADPRQLAHNFEESLRSWAASIDSHKLAVAKKALEDVVNHGIAGREAEYQEAHDVALKAWYAMFDRARLWNIGNALFRALLQNFTLPPVLRKKVEMAARAYYTRTKPKVRGSGARGDLEQIVLLEKTLSTYEAHLAVAKAAIAAGKTHQEEGQEATRIRVGPFTLVNTGGFSRETMQSAAKVVHGAATFAERAKVGAVCYGDVQITNKIGRTNVAAFYTPSTDELFIRADVKVNLEVEINVLHELGHRYAHKFLRGGERAMAQLYYDIKHHETLREIDRIKLPLPQEGDTIVSKGHTYTVVGREYAGRGLRIQLQKDDGTKAHTTVEGFRALQGDKRDSTVPGFKGFVTDYASKNASENFAEMFAYYCMGRLPESQVSLFEKTLFG